MAKKKKSTWAPKYADSVYRRQLTDLQANLKTALLGNATDLSNMTRQYRHGVQDQARDFNNERMMAFAQLGAGAGGGNINPAAVGEMTSAYNRNATRFTQGYNADKSVLAKQKALAHWTYNNQLANQRRLAADRWREMNTGGA